MDGASSLTKLLVCHRPIVVFGSTMRFRGVACFLLIASPWNIAAAKLRKQKGNHNQRKQESFQEDGYEDEDQIVEVIVGLNVDDTNEPTFTTMSNTIDLLADSVSLEELIPQIRSGVVRVPIKVCSDSP